MQTARTVSVVALLTVEPAGRALMTPVGWPVPEPVV